MDLMGSDALQSEDSMREMWGDSIKAVNCQHARITYDDFLMLTKGQTKEAMVNPSSDEMDLEGSVPSLLGAGSFGLDTDGSVSSLLGSTATLIAVPEVDSSSDEAETPRPQSLTPKGSGAVVDNDSPDESIVSKLARNISNHTPIPPKSPLTASNKSAPAPLAGHNQTLEMAAASLMYRSLAGYFRQASSEDVTSGEHGIVTPTSRRETTPIPCSNAVAAASLMSRSLVGYFRQASNEGVIQAGLVMRRGLKKQVSSEAGRNILRDNRMPKHEPVENSTRRDGRGRRSRKKSISDLSAMMSSNGQANDDVSDAKARVPEAPEDAQVCVPEVPEDARTIRCATIPGKFILTEDPFSKRGRYGSVTQWIPEISLSRR